MVAVIQLAIALGATAGGVVYELNGYEGTFSLSAAILCASAAFAYIAWRARSQRSIAARCPDRRSGRGIWHA